MPEWGGRSYIRTLSGAERDAFEAACLKGKGKNRTVNLANVRARFVATVACDADGMCPLSQFFIAPDLGIFVHHLVVQRIGAGAGE